MTMTLYTVEVGYRTQAGNGNVATLTVSADSEDDAKAEAGFRVREDKRRKVKDIISRTAKLVPITVILADDLDASIDGRGWGLEHERAKSLADAAPSMREFIEMTARLTKDHECAICRSQEDEVVDRENHKVFDMPSDDAVETLGGLISDARAIIERNPLAAPASTTPAVSAAGG